MSIEFNSIVHKHSFVPGVVPSPTELYPGELAINLADGKLYTTSGNGSIIDFNSINSRFNFNNAQNGYVLTYDSYTNTYRPQPIEGLKTNFGKLQITNLDPVYEIGTNLLGSGVATWTTNGVDSDWDIASGYISAIIPGGATAIDLVGPFNPLVKNRTINFPSFIPPTNPISANSIVFTLRGSRRGESTLVSSATTSVWRSKIYYGKSSNSNLTTPTFDIAAGTGSGTLLNTSNPKGPINQAIQVGSGPGYFYLFIHDSYTLEDTGPYYGLKYGGHLLVKDEVTTVSLLNDNGVTSTYKRYKSSNILNDSLTIIINPAS